MQILRLNWVGFRYQASLLTAYAVVAVAAAADAARPLRLPLPLLRAFLCMNIATHCDIAKDKLLHPADLLQTPEKKQQSSLRVVVYSMGSFWTNPGPYSRSGRIGKGGCLDLTAPPSASPHGPLWSSQCHRRLETSWQLQLMASVSFNWWTVGKFCRYHVIPSRKPVLKPFPLPQENFQIGISRMPSCIMLVLLYLLILGCLPQSSGTPDLSQTQTVLLLKTGMTEHILSGPCHGLLRFQAHIP